MNRDESWANPHAVEDTILNILEECELLSGAWHGVPYKELGEKERLGIQKLLNDWLP